MTKDQLKELNIFNSRSSYPHHTLTSPKGHPFSFALATIPTWVQEANLVETLIQIHDQTRPVDSPLQSQLEYLKLAKKQPGPELETSNLESSADLSLVRAFKVDGICYILFIWLCAIKLLSTLSSHIDFVHDDMAPTFQVFQWCKSLPIEYLMGFFFLQWHKYYK